MNSPEGTRPWSVLVIEDDEADALLLRRLVAASSETFHTDVCQTLRDAEQWLQQHDADLILLDQSLPDCHGLEGIDRIRQQHGDVPIVMLTGLDDEEMTARAMERGAADYLIKGESGPDELAQSLLRAIAKRTVS